MSKDKTEGLDQVSINLAPEPKYVNIITDSVHVKEMNKLIGILNLSNQHKNSNKPNLLIAFLYICKSIYY